MTKRRFRTGRAGVDPAVSGYPSGPGSPRRAVAAAISGLEGARWAVVVEGVSDQIALETVAGRLGRDFSCEGVVVVPVGGARAVGRFVAEHGRRNASGPRLVGLCDEPEEQVFRRAFGGDEGPESAAIFVCRPDLEGEMIRAVPQGRLEAILESEGDLRSFRTFQRQPEWRDSTFAAQMRRFLGAGARRKARYARLLAADVDVSRLPNPLSDLLMHIGPR